MMRFKFILYLIVMIFTTVNLEAQVEDYSKKDKTPRKTSTVEDQFEFDSADDGKRWDWSKARIGGNLGLAFYSGGVLVDASPTFGYRVHKVVEIGAGMKLFYYKDDDVPVIDNQGYIVGYIPYKDFIYGPIVYSRFYVWEGVYAMGQYEMANKEPYRQHNPDERINVHHLLIGGGYSSAIGNVGQINISLLYNVIDSDESIYQFGTFGNFPLLLNVSFGFGINKR